MPGTGPSPSRSAFPNQGDTDEDVKRSGGEPGSPTDSGEAANAPRRFEPPASPSSQNPSTSQPSRVSSDSSAQGSSTDGSSSQGQGVRVTDNPMLFGEKLKGLHKGIDEMVEAVETDRMAGGGGEAGPEKVVRRLKEWKEESKGWQSGKSKL